MKSSACLLVLAIFLGASPSARAADKLIVHEWGTFTCLQDEQGNALGGINVDDEPVPDFVWGSGFVHALAKKTPYYFTFGLPPYHDQNKGWRPADRDVTMRLETPVIYFYPPKGVAPQSIPRLEIHVDFPHGVLSQFYPYADTNGYPAEFPFDPSTRMVDLTSGLTWKDVQLGSTEKPVATDDQVWTTPREVGASLLEVKAPGAWTGNTEGPERTQAEHFLFYRGIGHLDSPLRLQGGDGSLGVWAQTWTEVATVDHAWLADIHADGSCAYQDVAAFGGKSAWWRPVSLTKIPGKFDAANFSADNLAKLKASMQDALIKAGLYPDEASAMLRTWELSYFKSPGLRFFYIVPRAWVDQALPLAITGAPADVTRVMVGRIELISDEQRETLARLENGPAPDLWALKEAAENALKNSKLTDEEKRWYNGGAKPLSDLGIAIPPPVQDYLSLGRFRDALIVHEQQEHPTAILAQFIKDYGLVPQQR